MAMSIGQDIKGYTITEEVNQGAMNIEDTVKLFSQIAEGLHVAHRNQVVHRDIKPGNILLDEEGTGFLADFGIAKDHTTTQSITNPDSFIGSPEYLAPEQDEKRLNKPDIAPLQELCQPLS